MCEVVAQLDVDSPALFVSIFSFNPSSPIVMGVNIDMSKAGGQ